MRIHDSVIANEAPTKQQDPALHCSSMLHMPSVMSALRCMSLCTCSLTTPSDRVTVLQVLESPNDSHPWIRFMAFHVELGEVAKARAVAEKALQTIHFRQALLDVAG